MSLDPLCPGQEEYPTGKEGHAGRERQETLAMSSTANLVPSPVKDHAIISKGHQSRMYRKQVRVQTELNNLDG